MVTPMKKVSELISSSIGDTLTNIKTWANVMYNVLEHGLVGDGVTDDTAALQTLINTAIAAGRKLIFFPHGQYYVTSLTNANQVVFIGDNASFVGGYTGTISEFSTKGYADTKVSKSGDTMTGSLVTPSVLVPYTPSSETDSIANYPNGITYSEAVNWFGDVVGTLITVKMSDNRNFQIFYEYGNAANPRMLTRSWHSTPNAWSPWAMTWNNLNNPASLGSNGYQKLASGLIIQWGTASSVPSNTQTAVTFPIAFPSSVWSAFAIVDTTETGSNAVVSSLSNTMFNVFQNGSTSHSVRWLAIGK